MAIAAEISYKYTPIDVETTLVGVGESNVPYKGHLMLCGARRLRSLVHIGRLLQDT